MPTYTLRSFAGTGGYLNVAGNHQVSQNRNVNIYQSTGSDDQKWVISSLSGATTRVLSAISTAYGLNVYRSGSPWNCDIHTVSDNATDSAIIVKKSGSYYKLQLANYPTMYLTAAGTSNNSNVYWAASTSGNSQLWKIETAGSVTPPTSYQWPTLSTVINSGFRTANRPSHDGIDIAPLKQGVDGDPIYAFADGVVAKVATPSTNPSEGYTIRLNHTNPVPSIGGKYIRTYYMHLCKKPTLTEGATVRKGQIIGYMGTTGDSTGTHLHFGVRYNTTTFTVGGNFYEGIDFIDPMKYF